MSNPRLKVAYLLGSLNRGGTETLMLDVFRQRGDAGFNMMGIFRKSGALHQEFINTNVPLRQIKPRFVFDLFYFIKLRKELRKNNIDIVHAQQVIDALYAHIACIGTGIKIVLTFHGFNYRYGRLNNVITKYIINKTNLNFYVSNFQKNSYLKNYKIRKPQNQLVVYNGISFEKFKSLIQKPLRQEFKIPDTSLLLGSVGNFVSVRDQMTICRFLNLLNQRDVDFAFIFAGGKSNSEPEKFDDCIKFCEEHNLMNKVFFPGSRTDIPNVLSQIDAFIYSTNHDTFGIAVIEAMAVGVPVFINDWEVMNEITEIGKYGVIYKTKDESDLLERFLCFLDQQEKYKEKAREDAIWALNKYSIQTFMDSLRQVYLSVYEK